jgi:hypothetical protein
MPTEAHVLTHIDALLEQAGWGVCDPKRVSERPLTLLSEFIGVGTIFAKNLNPQPRSWVLFADYQRERLCDWNSHRSICLDVVAEVRVNHQLEQV